MVAHPDHCARLCADGALRARPDGRCGCLQGAWRHKPRLRARCGEGPAVGAARRAWARARHRAGGPVREQDLPRSASRRRLPRAARGAAQPSLPRAARRGQPGALFLSADQARAGPQLREDARRCRARDDGAPPGRQDAGRRAVPDPDRVLGLPGRGSARPARLDRLARGDVRSARPGYLDGRRLADRPAARLRRGERADAWLGLLGRRLRSLRPSDHLRRLRRRRDRRRAELGQGRKVGMAGISFSGISQLFVAGTRPPHLAAIAPMSVTDDLYTARAIRAGSSTRASPQTWIEERRPTRGRRRGAASRTPARSSRQGDRHCRANQRLRLQTQNALRIQRRNPFRTPSLFDQRSPGAWIERDQSADVPRRPVPGRADRRALRREPPVSRAQPERLDLGPERRARGLARADARSRAGPSF